VNILPPEHANSLRNELTAEAQRTQRLDVSEAGILFGALNSGTPSRMENPHISADYADWTTVNDRPTGWYRYHKLAFIIS
jgi:hypothetical protein